MPEKNPVTLETVNRNPDGTVAAYEGKSRQARMHFSVIHTREEYEPNERIVDLNAIGVLFTWTVEPDATGTTLTLAGDTSRLMEMIDTVFFHGITHMKEALDKIKRSVEALP